MLDDNLVDGSTTTPDTQPDPTSATGSPRKKPATKGSARKPAAKAASSDATAAAQDDDAAPGTPKKSTARKSAAKKSTTKKAAAGKPAAAEPVEAGSGDTASEQPAAAKSPAKKSARKSTKKSPATSAASEQPSETGESGELGAPPTMLLFKAPEPTAAPRRRARKAAPAADVAEVPSPADEAGDEIITDDDETEGGATRRRRRRGGRRRRKPGEGAESPEGTEGEGDAAADEAGAGPDTTGETDGGDGTTRRRRRRRRTGDDSGEGSDDAQSTVVRVRRPRSAEDQITAVAGSTRLEAKKQRRREGREAGRRRAPIVSEAEFLARRESVERVMVIRQRKDLTQIAVLEDKVLVEHYVARESQTSLIGNVYLGRVQNVLPSMEAAFVDIGKGRNAVLYAGEVNWSGLGHKDGQPRKIESVLSSGQTVLVQVTKDPIGHKGARLTSQISLAGRFLVYVPDGTTSGISRKLPDTERNRLKNLLKDIVPDTAGVIVRTAAEGASEDELTRDVERLKARWEDIEGKAKGSAPQLLYGEPDLTLKVVRDLFTEDFTRMVIEGEDAWDTVQSYVQHVAPDLESRMARFDSAGSSGDAFSAYRIDEQIAKGLDRKVWLPSGGSLVIDRTEAMTVVDVNTGKFTGSGGNLEETVTKNNLEAAEEMARQLRLRDIGGIIVIDFIDMVLESNRDLVLRRLVECLGRDRTRHQVAEVTSLGLVQMTRKRIGTGLLEAFSQNCDHCAGRGVVVHDVPVEARGSDDDSRRGGGRRTRGARGRDAEPLSSGGNGSAVAGKPAAPSPRDVAAVAKHEPELLVAADGSVDFDQLVELDLPVDGGHSVELDQSVELDRSVELDQVLDGEAVASGPEATESASGPDAAPEPEIDPGPAPVRVVTRTRRRSASRPAGPPVVAATGEVPASGGVEPGTANHESGSSEPADELHVEHVPIKKRGTRKR